MSTPLFSIVIANYNYGRYLETAIQSVLLQSCKDFELIVVDGGSTDNSVEVIRLYEDRLAWWCSEPDQGQSDAFNKGFAHASGKFGCWLNADDMLMSGALETVNKYLREHSCVEWLGGSTMFFDESEKVLWCSRCMRVISALHKWLPAACVNGPSSFFLISNLHRVGGFDVSLKFCMDIDLWKRFFESGIKLYHVRQYLWAFRIHKTSKTSHRFFGKANVTMHSEGMNIYKKYQCKMVQIKLGEIIVRLLKFINGIYLLSYYDTKRYKRQPIQQVMHMVGRVGAEK